MEFNAGLGDDTGQWRLVEDREITPSFMEITQKLMLFYILEAKINV